MVTVTPGITASEASVTFPLIAPVPDVTACAKLRDAETRSNDKANANARRMGTLQGVSTADGRTKSPRTLRLFAEKCNYETADRREHRINKSLGRSVMRGSGIGGFSVVNFQYWPMVARSRMASVHANDSPMQMREPPPNGKYAYFGREPGTGNRDPAIHRSGLN